MEKIKLLKPDLFVQYKLDIGIILPQLNNNLNSNIVNFFTGHKHFKINRNELSIPSISAIQKELNRNGELTELAYDNDIVELDDQNVGSYLHYAYSYN
tara:strand:- start:857 stop:1150 length:294 start_codon:yes stop_codon:yes gene_type:complete